MGQKWTTRKASHFIERLRETGHVSGSASEAGIVRSQLYRKRDEDEGFRAAWDEALNDYVEALEKEADRRGYLGVDKPVFYKGDVVGTVKEYSDTLMIFRLKALNPDKYRESRDTQNVKVEHSGNVTYTLQETLQKAITEAEKARNGHEN